MSSTMTEHTPLEVLLNDSVMEHFNWSFTESCRAELAQLRTELIQLRAAYDAAIFAVNESARLHKEDVDKSNIELTQLRADVAQIESELNEAHTYLNESPVNSHDDPPFELIYRIESIVNQLIECRAERDALTEQMKFNRTVMTDAAEKISELREQLAVYQRRAAVRR